MRHRQVLFTVYVEVEVFLRQFVVRTVFTQLCKGFVEGGFQLGIIVGCPCEGATGSLALALCIGLLDLLHYLKEPRPAGDAVLLQSRRNGKAEKD